jgi:anti-sigma B factor antagonist
LRLRSLVVNVGVCLMASSDAVEVATANGSTLVVVTGEFDLVLADEFELKAIAGDGAIHVSLSAVTFLDSAGVRALVNVHNTAAGEGRALRVVDANPVVRRVLEICELEELLGIAAG